MANYIDEKYLKEAGLNLERFAKKKKDLYVCRCPICGDSKKNPNKTRGYFYVSHKSKHYNFKCHNCGASLSFANFLKENFPVIHRAYVLEKYAHGDGNKGIFKKPGITQTKQPVFSPKTKPYTPPVSSLSGLERLSGLPEDHPAVRYLRDRLVPQKAFERIYWTDDFMEFAAKVDAKYKADQTGFIEPRIVFPFLDPAGALYGANGRTIDPNERVRYRSIKDSTSQIEKCFGLELYDPDAEGYVVEGPVDALFLPNCLAIAGAGSYRMGKTIFNPDKTTLVYDNEPRNVEICNLMERGLRDGFRVCIWGPEFVYNDINDAIRGGWTAKKVKSHIDQNSFQKLSGLARIAVWRKC